jgi:hypothetical protein
MRAGGRLTCTGHAVDLVRLPVPVIHPVGLALHAKPMVRAGSARFRLWIFPIAPNLLVWPGWLASPCFHRPIRASAPFVGLLLGEAISPWLLAEGLELGSGYGLSIVQVGRHASVSHRRCPWARHSSISNSGSSKFANKEDAVTVFVSVEAAHMPADIDRRSPFDCRIVAAGARNLRSRKRHGEPK